MTTATKLQETRLPDRIQSVYRLSLPVIDEDGDETDIVAVSSIANNPDTGKPETMAFCVFPCEVHGAHIGSFAEALNNTLTYQGISHKIVLERLGVNTIEDGLAREE